MSAACDQCGIVTTAPELLEPVRRQRWCPPCLDRRQEVEARRLGRVVLAAGLLGLLVSGLVQPVGWLLLNLGVLLPLALYVSVTLHEVAHAVAAVLLGLRLRGLSLGHGPCLLRLGGLELHALPLAGFTAACGSGPLLGLRTALFLAAGPLANLLLLIALLPRLATDVLTELAAGPAPALLLVAASALSLLLSLWPNTGQGDGPAMLAALRGGAEWRARQQRSLRRLDAETALAHGDFGTARAGFEALVAEGGAERWYDLLALAECLRHEPDSAPRAALMTAEALAALPWLAERSSADPRR